MLLLNIIMRLTDSFWRLRKLAQVGPWGIRHIAAVIYDIYLDSRGSYIGLSASFANRPVFPHGPTGIFISGDAHIGQDCVIYQHVTIGSVTLSDSRSTGSPNLGAGAKIIGAVTLGDNVRVSANTVVTRDVPSNTVVVPAVAISRARESLDNRYYTKRDGRWIYYHNGAWHIEPSPSPLPYPRPSKEQHP
jgi:serine O-acetyltransferase